MENKAIVFLDYNSTFDDISEKSGKVFISALKRFCKHFDNNVTIAVITSANHLPPEEIKEDLSYTLSLLPKIMQNKFCYLIEEQYRYISKINCEDLDYPTFSLITTQELYHGTKKDGVEFLLDLIDPSEDIKTCVFVGDSDFSDLPMLNADIGNRQKIFLYANRKNLKTDYSVYKISLHPNMSYSLYNEVKNGKSIDNPFVVKTTNESFGVGKGLEQITNYFEERDRNK